LTRADAALTDATGVGTPIAVGTGAADGTPAAERKSRACTVSNTPAGVGIPAGAELWAPGAPPMDLPAYAHDDHAHTRDGELCV
jgi:hypothetical protein